jgi:hypothetical protein
MLYRIIIKTINGSYYYLTSDNLDNPETDFPVNVENIQFLSKLNPTHAHTFSTKELAEKFIKLLPFPYNEKASLLEVKSKEEPIIHRVYYRIGTINFGKMNYMTNDKKFTRQIKPETATFSKLDDAKEFFTSLSKFTQKTSCVLKVYDFGPPNYYFKDNLIGLNGEILKDFPIYKKPD